MYHDYVIFANVCRLFSYQLGTSLTFVFLNQLEFAVQPIFGAKQISSCTKNSVTRLGDLLDFGQLFKAFGNNKFAQISHILRQLL